jgi:hypothetical protein
LQNSRLRAVLREGATRGRPVSEGHVGRPTEVLRSQAVPIRERGAGRFLVLTSVLSKGLGRESGDTAFSRQLRSQRVWRKKNDNTKKDIVVSGQWSVVSSHWSVVSGR